MILLAPSIHARIGWTKAECDKKYGAPIIIIGSSVIYKFKSIKVIATGIGEKLNQNGELELSPKDRVYRMFYVTTGVAQRKQILQSYVKEYGGDWSKPKKHEGIFEDSNSSENYVYWTQKLIVDGKTRLNAKIIKGKLSINAELPNN